MKIAITSNDGKHINSHFGKEKEFHIYKHDETGIKYLEKRNSSAYGSSDPTHVFRPEYFEKVYTIIADCQALYTLKIGEAPAEKLRSTGMQVQEAEGDIFELLGS